MSADMAPLVWFVLMVAGLVLASLLLNVLWSREQVKKDLRQQGAAPIQVRWCPYPFGDWVVFYPATIAFRAMFVDATGCIQTARCVVHTWFHSVHWVRDDLAYLDRDLPAFWRSLAFAAALFLTLFGLRHLWSGTFVWPRIGLGGHPPAPWHGWPVTLLSIASLCGAVNLFAGAFFRSMPKAKERRWILFARVIAFLGWILFLASFPVALWRSSLNG